MKESNALFRSFHFKAKRPGPHLLITAGVHGDEYEPMLTASKLIMKVESMLTFGSVTIVPIVNESAFALGARCGSDGLDLARTCPGKDDGTITERVAADISHLIKNADYYIDMHTGGEVYDIYPLAGYMLHSEEKVLEKQREMAKAFQLPVVWGTDPYAQGRTLSVAREGKVPAIYVEYGGGISASGEIADAYFRGCIGVMHYLEMITGEHVPAERSLYWVEDYRKDYGHLQSKMPSPSDGIFTAAVRPGNFIKKDELWGEIYDPRIMRNTKIMAAVEGIVLFTRVAAKVKAGDSLGGILPISNRGKVIIHES